IRAVGNIIGRVAPAFDEIPGLEIDEFVGAGADRLQIGWRVARGPARVGLEQVSRDDHAPRTDESLGPERHRLVEAHAHGGRGYFFDFFGIDWKSVVL